jgi:O-antigen/teichoic acid export membrane protein
MENAVKIAEASARSGFFLVSGTSIATIILAVASIVVGRLLGSEQYGQYTLVLVVTQLLLLFTDLGVNQGIIKFATQMKLKGESERIKPLIRCGLIVKLITGLCLSLVLFVFADGFASIFLQRPALASYLQIAASIILFQAMYETAVSSFIGLDKTEYHAIATNIHAVSKAVFSILFVVLGLHVTGAILGYLLSFIIATAISIALLTLLLRKTDTKDLDTPFRREVQSLIRYGAPLYLSLLLMGFMPLYQNVVLAFYTSDVAIGNFKAASNFATFLAVISAPIPLALLPAFTKFTSSATKHIQGFFQMANKYTTLLLIPLVLFIIVSSKEIMAFIYGSTYESAYLYLSLQSLIYFLAGFGSLTLSSLYNGLGETKTTLKMSLITFLSLIALSPLLTGFFGVPGIIVAYLVSNSLGVAYGSYVAKRRFQTAFAYRSIIKIYVVATVSCLPVILLNGTAFPLVVKIGGGLTASLVVYVTLLPLMKILSPSELHTLKDVTKRIKGLSTITRPLFQYQELLLHKST